MSSKTCGDFGFAQATASGKKYPFSLQEISPTGIPINILYEGLNYSKHFE